MVWDRCIRNGRSLEQLELGNCTLGAANGLLAGQTQEPQDWGGRSDGDMHQLGKFTGKGNNGNVTGKGKGKGTGGYSHTQAHARLAMYSDTVSGTSHT